MRIDDVAERKVDAECGTTTITLSRMETVDFSVPIFVDGGSALVRGGDNAPTTRRRSRRQAYRGDARHHHGSGAHARARAHRPQGDAGAR